MDGTQCLLNTRFRQAHGQKIVEGQNNSFIECLVYTNLVLWDVPYIYSMCMGRSKDIKEHT